MGATTPRAASGSWNNPYMETPTGKKWVELRAEDHRRDRCVLIDAASSGVTVPVFTADGIGDMTYRPTGLHRADGIEIWTPQAWNTH